MAESVVAIHSEELKALCAKLNGMALSAGDKRSLLARVGVEMESQTEEHFRATKSSPDGDSWKALADSTKKHYLKKFGTVNPGHGLLFRFGELRDSVRSEADSEKVLVGATKVYAAVHQFGWDKKNIPPRPYLGMGAGDAAEIMAIISEFLAERAA